MLGLKNLPINKLTTAFMAISAAMVIFAASAPANSASTTMLSIWTVCALVLIGMWSAVAIEIFKSFFGGGDRRENHHGEQSRKKSSTSTGTGSERGSRQAGN